MHNQHSAATLFATLLGHMRPSVVEEMLESLLESHCDEQAPDKRAQPLTMEDFVELLVDDSPRGAVARELQQTLLDLDGRIYDPSQKANVPDDETQFPDGFWDTAEKRPPSGS